MGFLGQQTNNNYWHGMKKTILLLKWSSALSIFIVPIPGQKILVPNGFSLILMAFDGAGFDFKTLLGYLGLIGIIMIFLKNKWLSSIGYLLALDGIILTLITNKRIWSQPNWLFWLLLGTYFILGVVVIFKNFNDRAHIGIDQPKFHICNK